MIRRTDRSRPGIALLEVLVALVILVTAGAAAVTLVGTVLRSVARARQRDVQFQTASAFLDNVVLWSSADLDRHLGVRAEGEWQLEIQRPVPSVYAIRLVDTLSSQVLLETTVFRRQLIESPYAH